MKISKFIISSLAVATLAVTGCAGDPEPQPTVTVTSEPQTVTPEPKPEETTPQAQPELQTAPGGLTDREFAVFIYSELPGMTEASVAEIVEFAETTCDALDNGATVKQLFGAVADNVETSAQAEAMGFLIGASVANYCPEHTEKIENGIDNGTV